MGDFFKGIMVRENNLKNTEDEKAALFYPICGERDVILDKKGVIPVCEAILRQAQDGEHSRTIPGSQRLSSCLVSR